MKRTMLFVLCALLTILSVSTILPVLAHGGNANDGSDVEITPKISVKGPKGGGKPPPPGPAATGVIGAPLLASAQRWAVVIGISDYAGTANDIQYADDDAIDMLSALTTVYGYMRNHIKLLISDYVHENATRDEIISAISWLRGSEVAGDEVVFFYSGHGARSKRQVAIVPYECTASSLIWDVDLKSMFSTFETTRIVFIFDSCYAGGMTDLAASGRIICMATTENKVAYETGDLQNGVFTYYFVDQGIVKGLADTEGTPGVVTVEEAFDYARANVPIVVPQTPTISDSFVNDMLL